jgi:hypothetical protein
LLDRYLDASNEMEYFPLDKTEFINQKLLDIEKDSDEEN